MRPSATSRLRMVGYCLLLTAFAFVQQPGRLVGDTKFDLVVDPFSFLGRAWHLWDPLAAFGQVQNQAYGYFWPMGPFFLLGHVAALPEWAVQRLWWSLLLCLAFVGVVLLARALRIGTPASQVLAGFAYALSAHVLTLLGPTSVEAWPTAVAPWVLLPLVVGAERGSPRRAAALSALAVALCGGVNAVAVSAVLPIGAIWLLTRERGRRRRSLILWWPTLTVVATLWWTVPLLIFGRYSAPFLDYIENASITTSTTSLPDVLAGTSDWVSYASPQDWIAGHMLGMTPLLLVDAAVVAGLGLAGVCRRDNPHSRFLLLAVVTGVLLVGFGYAGPGAGWFADERQSALDGALAAFRNLHKYDVVLRLPLVLGLAHLVAVFQPRAANAGDRALRTGVLLAAVSAVVGVAIPVYTGQLAPGAPVQAVPDYWSAAARFLAGHSAAGTALELPASPFGDYLWGSPHDDILQTLAHSPWAVRNVVPLAQPGNVRLLDAVTRVTELGSPDPQLAEFLSSNGIGYLVVRNDLQVFRSGAPDPVVLHQALDRSPGLRRVAAFGPGVGTGAEARTPGGARLLTDRGRSATYPAVEIYQVGHGAPRASGWQVSTVPVVSGDPGSRLGTDVAGTPALLAGDAAPGVGGPTILTDGLQRREMAFTAVRQNESATMTPTAPWRLRSVEHNHRLYGQPSRWQTTERWWHVADVTASSSRAYADAVPPVDPSKSPAAAVDGRLGTEFVSSARSGATGQWWRMRLRAPVHPGQVTVTMGRTGTPRVSLLALSTARGSVTVAAPAPGESGTFALPPGSTRYVEVRVARVTADRPGAQLALAEVSVPGVTPVRTLATPARAFGSAPDQIVLTRSPQRRACAVVDGTTVCNDFLRTGSGDGNVVRRVVSIPDPAAYAPQVAARVRLSARAAAVIARHLPVQVTGTRPLSTDPAAGALATVDQDEGTTWVASKQPEVPRLQVSWKGTTRLRHIQLALGDRAGASAPRDITLVAGAERRSVVLDAAGRGSFRPLDTDRLTIRFGAVRPAYSAEGDGIVRLPVGVSEIRLPELTASRGWSPFDPVGLGCGSGPALQVGNTTMRTRLDGSLSSMLSGAELPASLCDQPAGLGLAAGANVLALTPSRVAVPEQLTLRRLESAPAAPVAVPLQITRWGQADRRLRVPARSDPTLLVVNENLNAGWRARFAGHTLPVQRVDGWKQGWLVPAGAGGLVRLDYVPERPYQLGLLGGAAGLLAVGLLAVRRRSRRSAPALTGAGPGWVDAGFYLVAGGLVAGLVGALVVGVALVLRPRDTERDLAGWAAALLAAAAGGAMALRRTEAFHAHSTAAQVLECLALGFAVLGANHPTFFRRSSGRSST